MSIKQLVPRLRFSVGKNSWKPTKGGVLFKRRTIKGKPGLPVYSVSQGERFLVPRKSLTKRMKGDAKPKDNFIAYPEDITYNTMRMWQGAMAIAQTECMVSPAYVVLTPSELANSGFFSYFLKRERPLYDLWAHSYGLTDDRLRLYYKDFSQINFVVPDVNEQQKITTFLSSVDQKISQLKQKHVLLQGYKKGVMQQLFSHQIRFKDDKGLPFEDWQETRLSKLLDLKLNSIDMQDESEYELITVRRRNRGVDSRGIYRGKDVLVKTQFALTANQFVISKRQIVHGACGVVPESLKGAIVSNEYNVFDPVEGKLDVQYFNLFSQTIPMKRAYFINSDGVHIEKLLFKTKSWLKTKVSVPCFAEQKRIVEFIESIEQKINQVAQQIEQAQQFKKGLLQQMFV